MDPSKVQSLCQFGIAIFSILVILCGYGAHHYGRKASEIKESRQAKETKDINKAVLELRDVILEGDKQLIKQVEKREVWDFREGTVLIWVYKENFFGGQELGLNIISKENKASILLRKDASDYVQFVYTYPTIGSITRGTKITATDFEGQSAVLLGFTWNLDESKTSLYVNGVVRLN